MFEQPPHCEQLRLSLTTGRFVHNRWTLSQRSSSGDGLKNYNRRSLGPGTGLSNFDAGGWAGWTQHQSTESSNGTVQLCCWSGAGRGLLSETPRHGCSIIRVQQQDRPTLGGQTAGVTRTPLRCTAETSTPFFDRFFLNRCDGDQNRHGGTPPGNNPPCKSWSPKTRRLPRYGRVRNGPSREHFLSPATGLSNFPKTKSEPFF